MSCTRRVPDLDYLTECDNRVWGCSSGENVIYACKLGDPTNWFSYRNTAADSYAVTVGSDGSFTGAATCMGSVLFFKENTLHKLCGSKPSDFQLSSLRCRGVAKYAAESLCVINETLYYLSPEGGDGLGRQPAGEGVGGCWTPAVWRAPSGAAGGWLDGRYYLYLAWGQRRPAAGVRHRKGTVAPGGPRTQRPAGAAVQRAASCISGTGSPCGRPVRPGRRTPSWRAGRERPRRASPSPWRQGTSAWRKTRTSTCAG